MIAIPSLQGMVFALISSVQYLAMMVIPIAMGCVLSYRGKADTTLPNIIVQTPIDPLSNNYNINSNSSYYDDTHDDNAQSSDEYLLYQQTILINYKTCHLGLIAICIIGVLISFIIICKDNENKYSKLRMNSIEEKNSRKRQSMRPPLPSPGLSPMSSSSPYQNINTTNISSPIHHVSGIAYKSPKSLTKKNSFLLKKISGIGMGGQKNSDGIAGNTSMTERTPLMIDSPPQSRTPK
jgi:hypothetical protein